jgi:hypothetical protein
VSNSKIGLNPGAGGSNLDAELLVGQGPGGVDICRSRNQITGETLAEIARVLNQAPVGTEYALVVRPIVAQPTQATIRKVAVSVASVELFAASDVAKARKLYNDSAVATLYVKEGAVAGLDDFSFPIGPNGFYEWKDPVYAGRIDGIWDQADAAGKARLTEET